MRNNIILIVTISFFSFITTTQAQNASFHDFLQAFPEKDGEIHLTVGNNNYLYWELYVYIPNADDLAVEFQKPISFTPVAKKGKSVLIQVNIGVGKYIFEKINFEGENPVIEKFNPGDVVAMN